MDFGEELSVRFCGEHALVGLELLKGLLPSKRSSLAVVEAWLLGERMSALRCSPSSPIIMLTASGALFDVISSVLETGGLIACSLLAAFRNAISSSLGKSITFPFSSSTTHAQPFMPFFLFFLSFFSSLVTVVGVPPTFVLLAAVVGPVLLGPLSLM